MIFTSSTGNILFPFASGRRPGSIPRIRKPEEVNEKMETEREKIGKEFESRAKDGGYNEGGEGQIQRKRCRRT